MTVRILGLLTIALEVLSSPAALHAADPVGHITGIGGIFFKSKDPKALTAWYRDVLGLPVESWGAPCCVTTRRITRQS
jgi:hypothetical protein